MCSGSWPLSTLSTRSGTTWLMASLTLPDMTSESPERPTLADAHAVERPQDGVRQLVLLPRALGEVLRRELLEAIRGDGRWAGELGSLGSREYRGGLEHHGRGDDHDALEAPVRMRVDGCTEGRREDALVLCEQVERIPVEVADAADHRCRRDHLVTVLGQLGQQHLILGVALDEGVPRVRVVAPGDGAVLAEVVNADDRVTRLQQFRDQVPVDEPGRPGDQDPQAALPVVTRTADRTCAGASRQRSSRTRLAHGRGGGQRPVVLVLAGTSVPSRVRGGVLPEGRPAASISGACPP